MTLRDDVQELLAEIQVGLAEADAREAVGWVVVSLDLELARLEGDAFNWRALHLVGTYATGEEALIAADAANVDVNRNLGADELPWKHAVLPLFKP